MFFSLHYIFPTLFICQNQFQKYMFSHEDSEKDNGLLQQLVCTKNENEPSLESIVQEKIQTALNELNSKMKKFNDQRKIIEHEIKLGVRASTASLMSSSSDSLGSSKSEPDEQAELLTIKDYQSVMESQLQTEVAPTRREQRQELQDEILNIPSRVQNQLHTISTLKTSHHTATFSKTQNIKDILRGINDVFSIDDQTSKGGGLILGDSINNLSMTNSVFQTINGGRTGKNGAPEDGSVKFILEKQHAGKPTRAQINLQNLSKISKSIFASVKSSDKTQSNLQNQKNLLKTLNYKLSDTQTSLKNATTKASPKKDRVLINSYAQRKDLGTSQEQNNAQNIKLIQEQLHQYQKIIKEQRSELDKQRRMNEKLKKTLESLVVDQKQKFIDNVSK